MSIRKREGSPFWWYDFTIGGTRFRGSTGETDKRKAREAERDQQVLAKDGQVRRDNWRLIDVLATYWDERGNDRRSADTIFHQLAMLRLGLDRNLLISKLTNAMLMDYRAKRRGGLGVQEGARIPQAHSINREIVLLRAALRWCHNLHGQPLPKLAWKEVRAAEPPNRTRFASHDEYQALLDAAHEDLKPIIICAVATGLRLGNILNLDWTEVSLSSGWITVRVKGNKEHSARIAPHLRAVLSRTADKDRKGKVFVTTNFRRRWTAALKTAGMANFKFHDLRHTFGSWARQSGADIADIKEAMGHSTVEMTMRYAHIKPDEHVTAFDRVSERLAAQFTAQEARKRQK